MGWHMAQPHEGLPAFLKQGTRARLIPSVAETQKERRTTSTVLAAMESVEDFGRVMLGMVGAPTNKRSRIACYTEVVFAHGKGESRFRPDGLIVVDNGHRTWAAIVEAKVGTAELERAQIESYLDIARQHQVDAVVTISNQFAALPTHHPIDVDKRRTRSVALYHWSWMSITSEAELLANHRGIEFRGRAFILQELLRYLQDPSSGVLTGMRMSSGWRNVCEAVQRGERLKNAKDDADRAAGDWHQLLRYLALRMSVQLGRPVSVHLSRSHTTNPEARLHDTVSQLLQEHTLEAEFVIPDAAAHLKLTVDLSRRNLVASMRLKAPADRAKPWACVTWLVNQLPKSDGDAVLVRAIWPGRAPDTDAPLGVLREDRKAIVGPGAGTMPVAFEVREVRDIASRIKGAKTFVDEVDAIVEGFYEAVGQHVKAWVPPPPKVTKEPAQETVPKPTAQERAAVAGEAELPVPVPVPPLIE